MRIYRHFDLPNLAPAIATRSMMRAAFETIAKYYEKAGVLGKQHCRFYDVPQQSNAEAPPNAWECVLEHLAGGP